MCIGESAHLPTTSSTKPVESVLVIPDGATIKIARPQTVSSHPKKRPASSLPTGSDTKGSKYAGACHYIRSTCSSSLIPLFPILRSSYSEIL